MENSRKVFQSIDSLFLFVCFRTRRMSWITSRDAQREKLEGSLLTVCLDCKEMVVQVRNQKIFKKDVTN